MKIKLFTLFLAFVASVGTIFASTKIGDLYYNLDAEHKTAAVTQSGDDEYSGDIIIPSSVTNNAVTYIVTTIAGAFSRCTDLTSVTIPNSVTQCWHCSFYRCYSLVSVVTPALLFNEAYSIFGLDQEPEQMPSHITHVMITGGDLNADGFDHIRVSYRRLETIDLANTTNTELPDMALSGCYKLQTITLPQSLKRIGYMAIADCKNLQAIDIPASVTEISQSAFENCRSLKTVTFGGQTAAPGRFNVPAAASQLQTIGNWAFYNCHELQNIEIPEGVTYIGDGAFYGCVYLENLSLPSSVQTIGDNTFALCEKLQQIIVNAVVPPSIQAKTFYDVNRQIPVYVPDECVDAYKNDTYWREFNIVGRSQMPASIDQISVSASSEKNTRKVLHDGQIYITRDEKVYTITGQEVR